MEQAAAAAPAGRVIAIMSNVMNARRWVHASPSFLQFDLTDPAASGRGACVRAIEEAAAYVARGHRDIITGLTGRDFDEVVFTGGAAKGRLWPQIMADVLGVPVHIPVVTESSALGAAICAGVGAGVYAGLTEPRAAPAPAGGHLRTRPGRRGGLRRALRGLAGDLPAPARHHRRRPAQPALASGRGLAAPAAEGETTPCPTSRTQPTAPASPPRYRHGTSRSRSRAAERSTGACRAGWRASSAPRPGGP